MARPLDRREIAGLVAWVLGVFVAALLASIGSINAGDFYTVLDRPAWTPPAWLFGPMWTALYALMAFAAWLVWRERGAPGIRAALVLFVVQLALNVLWSWLFFVGQWGALAFVEIVVLWVLVVATVIVFWRIRPLAGGLLLPYLAWVTLASALAFTLWQRNPELLG